MSFQVIYKGLGIVKTEEAVRHFGSIKALADALGIWPQAVYLWGEDVPQLRAYQIKEIMAKAAAKKEA